MSSTANAIDEPRTVFEADELFVADINPANDHSYSLKVQTVPEVEIETVIDTVVPTTSTIDMTGR